MDNSNKQNMNNFGHKLPTFEQVAWAVDDRAILNHCIPEAHTNIQAIEKADLTNGSQSGWFNTWSDIAIDEQSFRDIFTHLEYSQPSLPIPGTESNFEYLSAKLLPSTSILDDQLLRGTRSAPIIIHDSPDRDKSPDHGERYQSCHKRKRARELDSEVEIMCLHNMKKAKKLADSQIRNESQLPSIQAERESNEFVAGWDGVQYVNGRMLIPLGRDLFLEELLSTTMVHEYVLDSQDDFFPGLPDSTLQYVTRCTNIPPSLRPQTSLRHKGFIEIF